MEYKYISSVPKPLLNDFVNNRVIPFVGAGFSKNADIPKGLSMPDWNEMGKLAADEIDSYKYEGNAIDALSYYENLFSRTKLVEMLMRELHFGKIKPGFTHKAFCNLFTGTICTTNFDTLIEETMSSLNRPFSVVATKDRLSVKGEGESKIIKLHGDFNHPDRMVVTEQDYDLYLEKNPIFATYIANLFITNTMLLIGYSLDDSDFRSIWQIINGRLGGMSQPAYCVTVNASADKIARYGRRNIKVINLIEKEPEAEYKTVLCDFFVEIKDYVDKKKDEVVKSSDEKINEQMIIPAEDNNLCFISCAMSRIAQLSALLNPILKNNGITPVRIDEMLMWGDNWIDKSNTAIRKSKASIVDVSDSSSNVMLELGLIKSIKPDKNILIVCEKGKVIPSSLSGYKILTYTFDDIEVKEESYFCEMIEKWLQSVFEINMLNSNNSEDNIFTNARRLMQKGEYSASIISAFSELEYRLTLKNSVMNTSKGKSTFLIFRYLREQYETMYDINELISVRNKIVHENYVANAKEAVKYFDMIEEINKKECLS